MLFDRFVFVLYLLFCYNWFLLGYLYDSPIKYTPIILLTLSLTIVCFITLLQLQMIIHQKRFKQNEKWATIAWSVVHIILCLLLMVDGLEIANIIVVGMMAGMLLTAVIVVVGTCSCYVIMLNGIFGMYVGLCYNEAFAFPMNFFGGTRWMAINEPDEFCSPEWSLDGGCFQAEMYPMGIDPIWHRTTNKITFFNSYKMKISIVVGVLQMTVGIILSLLNHLEYRDWKKVFFQFIPEFVFFQGIFGYLVFTILYKWSVDWTSADGVPHIVGAGPEPAPSLLTLLINMFMAPTTDITVPLYGHLCFTDCAVAKEGGYCSLASVLEACPVSCDSAIAGLKDTLADAASGMETKLCVSPLQQSIQFALLVAAFIAVPFLLFPIPFIQLYQHKQSAKYKELADDDEGDDEGGFSFGDAFIHQAIHTIEFVLGSISNTASYLRLWALSLAHSQLAELFKDMILVGAGLNLGLGPKLQWIMTFICFGAWAIISFVVLMVMENLSSFLHALRLQWVEFQNKFFYGDGQKYSPFDFEKLKKSADEE